MYILAQKIKCCRHKIVRWQQEHRSNSKVEIDLLQAGQRLLAVIRKNEGGANKDLAKFADQINALADKWDR